MTSKRQADSQSSVPRPQRVESRHEGLRYLRSVSAFLKIVKSVVSYLNFISFEKFLKKSSNASPYKWAIRCSDFSSSGFPRTTKLSKWNKNISMFPLPLKVQENQGIIPPQDYHVGVDVLHREKWGESAQQMERGGKIRE